LTNNLNQRIERLRKVLPQLADARQRRQRRQQPDRWESFAAALKAAHPEGAAFWEEMSQIDARLRKEYGPPVEISADGRHEWYRTPLGLMLAPFWMLDKRCRELVFRCFEIITTGDYFRFPTTSG